MSDFKDLQRASAAQEAASYREAQRLNQDRWVPACGGAETPTKARSGRTYLYVFNPRLCQHAWLDVETDLLTFEDPY